MYIENDVLDNLSKQVEEKLQLVKAYDPKSEEGKEAWNDYKQVAEAYRTMLRAKYNL